MHAISASTFCRDSLWCCYEALSLAFISSIISPESSHHKLRFFYFPAIPVQQNKFRTIVLCQPNQGVRAAELCTLTPSELLTTFSHRSFPKSVFRTLQDYLIQIFVQLPLIPLKLCPQHDLAKGPTHSSWC